MESAKWVVAERLGGDKSEHNFKVVYVKDCEKTNQDLSSRCVRIVFFIVFQGKVCGVKLWRDDLPVIGKDLLRSVC